MTLKHWFVTVQIEQYYPGLNNVLLENLHCIPAVSVFMLLTLKPKCTAAATAT